MNSRSITKFRSLWLWPSLSLEDLSLGPTEGFGGSPNTLVEDSFESVCANIPSSGEAFMGAQPPARARARLDVQQQKGRF